MHTLLPNKTPKLIATLRVLESDKDCTSGLHSVDENRFDLILCPNETTGNGLVKRSMPEIMAHELGHFVGRVLKLPAEVHAGEIFKTVSAMGIPGDYTPKQPSEREAWQVAETILPGAMETDAYKFSMDAYAKYDKELARQVSELPSGPRQFFRKLFGFGKDVSR